MPATQSPPTVDADELLNALAARRPPCECEHPNRLGRRCGHQASARVTVVCVAKGCNNAAGVYLLCRECLAVWKRNARRDGVRLRVKPL